MILEFYKYQATGNDFIIIDDREELFDINDSALINALCQRSFGIGADGLILLRDDKDYDFRMIYFNSDGFESSLCGNGARCIVKFAHLLEITSENINFITTAGVHQARISESDVSIKFIDINDINKYDDDLVIDSGSPHYVTFSENIDQIDIDLEGSNIRNSTPFKKKGINVNFLQVDVLFFNVLFKMLLEEVDLLVVVLVVLYVFLFVTLEFGNFQWPLVLTFVLIRFLLFEFKFPLGPYV